MAAPRVSFAMAQAGAFFPSFDELHSRFGTPANSILLQTGLALALLLLGSFDHVLAYMIFSAVLFLALAASTLFRMREPVRGGWFPVTPNMFIGLCALVAMLMVIYNPVPASIGVAIVICGLPLRRFLASRPVILPATSERD